MKIAWVTPFSNKSAIGMVGRDVCEELAKECDIDIWTHNTDDLIKTSVNVINFNSNTKPQSLDKYDCIFYNMGNYAANHKHIYDMLVKKEGYVILHDQTMAGFWQEYYFSQEFGENSNVGFLAYKNMIKKYYGTREAVTFQEAYDSGNYYKYIEDFKLIKPLLENALGVFTHAHFFAQELKDFFNGSVGISYLPCKAPQKSFCDDEKIIKIITDARKKGKKILVSNGMVGPGKQIDKVAKVLCDNRQLAEKYCYIVIGAYAGEYGERLVELANNKLKGCLFMMNYQPYNVMEYTLENADMCINMRYPNSEVCSLSLFEQMSYSKPVLVLNSGIYGEIPEYCIVRIEYKNIEKELKNVFENIEKNAQEYNIKGNNARNFVEQNCNAQEYAKKILAFFRNAKNQLSIVDFENKFFDRLSAELKNLGINEDTAPATVENVIAELSMLYGDAASKKGENKTLGIWAGFLYKIPGFSREGISRFMSFLCESLVKIYNVKIEIWAYSFNLEEMKICFSSILNNEKYKDKIELIDEINWKYIFNPSEKDIRYFGEINEIRDNLAYVAREFSKADVFMPLIVSLDNVIETQRKILVPAHDIAVAQHYEDFLEKDVLYKSIHLDISYRAENLARYGAEFSSNCKTVMEKQVLKYVKNLKPQKAHYVYLPVNIPEGIENNLMTEEEVRSKFNIEGRYMYYPTQIRPYKNISLLVKAFNELKSNYSDLKLVLTGNPKDMPEVDGFCDKFDLRDKIVLLKNLSEKELYSIYKYASVVPVTSKFEGGFPWQAGEALFMNVPLILSNIDVVQERIEKCGFTMDNVGVCLFDPRDYKKLANGISYAIDNREEYLNKQSEFSRILLSWNWKSAAGQYYDILFGDNGESKYEK